MVVTIKTRSHFKFSRLKVWPCNDVILLAVCYFIQKIHYVNCDTRIKDLVQYWSLQDWYHTMIEFRDVLKQLWYFVLNEINLILEATCTELFRPIKLSNQFCTLFTPNVDSSHQNFVFMLDIFLGSEIIIVTSCYWNNRFFPLVLFCFLTCHIMPRRFVCLIFQELLRWFFVTLV